MNYATQRKQSPTTQIQQLRQTIECQKRIHAKLQKYQLLMTLVGTQEGYLGFSYAVLEIIHVERCEIRLGDKT